LKNIHGAEDNMNIFYLKMELILNNAQLLPYINLEPSIYNKKQCGLSIKNYKLLIDKYLTKENA
jgi:hypothetical protein